MADNHVSHNTFTAKGSLWLAAILSLLLFSACNRYDKAEVDRLNDLAYSCHYSNQDSTLHYATKAIELAADNYDDGTAEALNNLAFVDIRHLRFDEAQEKLDRAVKLTDNQIELMIAYVQKMHIDRLKSENREFYTNREKADACLRRIEEEKGMLTERQQRRRIYAETEYRLVCADYYRVLGQDERMQRHLQRINPYGEIRQDTAQYLNYLCMANALYANKGADLTAASEHFATLVSVFATARKKEYIFFAALSMMELGEYLLDAERVQYLQTANAAGMTYINANEVEDDLLAGWLTESALLNFTEYGDACLSAQADIQLARCCHELQEYHAALDFLDKAVNDADIEKVPALMADIHEQYSVAFSALDNKPQSDYHRNLFLDLRELTRQDRYYESRAEQLDTMSAQQNTMIALAVAAILLLVFMLHYFNYLSKKPQRNSGLQDIVQSYEAWKEKNDKEKADLLDAIETLQENIAISRNKVQKEEEENLEARAKVQMLNGMMPLIDRIKHEVNMLKNRNETAEQRKARYEYITEIAREIDRNNDILTKWIELKQGQVRLQIETFSLQPLFDIIEKNKSSFAAKGITLNVEHTNCKVKADRVLTLFMLNTLADNARKFTPQGGSVTINSCETDEYVEISVADTGCGLTEEQQKTIFTRQISGGHGFGLLNCRGIMEKYKKTSRLFASCMLAVESRMGEGSRFFFRLPRGIVKMLIAVIAAMNIVAGYAKQADEDMQMARQYADSAYYSNIAATYERTLMFSDSCRKYLNLHYTHAAKGKENFMLRNDDGSVVAPEIQWLRDSIDTDYSVIIDIRNETAVAALALHEWDLYRYNNDIYTQLFQELSADNTIGDYCRTMERQQTNKDVAIIILTVVLLMIIPGYYFLFYRKRLRTRRETVQQKAAEIEKTKEREAAEKASLLSELEILGDEYDASEQELDGLHVSNSILDNCLSAIKHETMYYPSRIVQMVENGDNDVQTLDELVTYYREIYSMLGSQTQSQMERRFLHIRHIMLADLLPSAPTSIYITGDKGMMQYLFRILKRHVGDRLSEARIAVEDRRNVVIAVEGNFNNDIDYMLCRQILREHGEATANRACGIVRGEGVMELTLCGGERTYNEQQTK